MNKKIPLLLLTVFALASCSKTKLLYGERAYNSPIFDENYYTEWEGIKDLKISEKMGGIYRNLTYSDGDTVHLHGQEIENYKWINDPEFGYNNNLAKIEKKFNYGMTSKLFDGRVRCEGYYQESRVQLDKSGFAMFFPKVLGSAKYLGFAARGGTDLPDEQRFDKADLKINFIWSFYIHLDNGEYNKVVYDFNAEIPVDHGQGGNTAFVNFSSPDEEFFQIYGAVAMSLEWKCIDTRIGEKDLTDDYTNKEKHHLSVMLYEVFIGDSVWY